MHLLFMPPVGWGFMLVHSTRNGTVIVTDGGSLPPCFGEAFKVVKTRLTRIINSINAWAWILSHFDYDHYSITGGLIRDGLWPKPKLVALPGTYSPQVCRETYMAYHMIASILAYMLKISPPPSWVLINILSSARRSGQIIGATQGAKLYVGELAYRIIWPPASGVEGLCGRLLEKLREKLHEILERCRRSRGEECDEVMRRSDEEGADLIEVLAPSRVVADEDQDLAEILRGLGRTPRSGEGGFKEPPETPRIGAEPLTGETYENIYTRAAEKLGDRELHVLHRNIVNVFSLAYALEFRDKPLGYMTIVEVKEFSEFSTNIWAIWRAIYHRLQIPPSPLLLYLSDLEGDTLTRAVDYYRQYSQTIAIEIAAHHGNAYSPALRKIAPSTIFIPRCDNHTYKGMRGNFKYQRRRCSSAICTRIHTGHTYGLEVEIW